MRDMVDAVVFDMDGVLFDTERICSECWRQIGKEWKLPHMEQVIHTCIGLNDTDTAQVFSEFYGLEFPFLEFKKRNTKLFYEKIDADGLPIKTGVFEILDYLKDKGCRIGLASSTRETSVRSHIKNAGIEACFEVVVGGDMVTHSKPNPEIYQIALKKLSVEPGRAVAIEDSANGIKSAYQAGMKPIMVPDLVEPSKEIIPMTYKICRNLLEVITEFEK